MLHDWHDFYLLIGEVTGALIGLLFVVASLAGRMESGDPERGRQIYLSPVVYHFAVVLSVSALALAPGLGPRIVGGVILLGGLGSLFYALMLLRAFFTGKAPSDPHWSDPVYYGAAPAVIYAGIAASGGLLEAQPTWAQRGLALGLLVLLLVSIRNAWDLITWIAPRARGPSGP